MKLVVNGQPTELADGQTVRALLEQLGLADRPVAVEVNRKIVPKRDHETTALAEGDTLEVVTLVGGG